ncbi:MAG: SDR family oxidoreductase [Caldisericia bacterium]|nr:SDR family oxidoreductase [Caldisericia bacterium]
MLVGVTGANGVLGKIITKKLSALGYEYVPFSGDIRNINDVANWVDNNNFDSVIHLAAIVPPSEVKNDLIKAFEVNCIGTKNLVDALNAKSQKPWLFYASTCHVYKSSNKPLSEDDPIEPISEYGLTKYAGEVLIRKNYDNACIGRIFSIYHKTQKPPFLYPTMLQRLQNEDLTKEFELYGAESIRDFSNAEDVADIIIKLMERKVVGTYNIASGNGVKIRDFVQSLTDIPLKIKDMGGQDTLVADVNKLNKLLNNEKEEHK